MGPWAVLCSASLLCAQGTASKRCLLDAHMKHCVTVCVCQCHYVTQSLCHCVTESLFHYATESLFHYVTQPLCPCVTLQVLGQGQGEGHAAGLPVRHIRGSPRPRLSQTLLCAVV